jgi:hypothetical protein
VAIEDADDEAERVDAEPCRSGVFIVAGIAAQSMIHPIGIRRLSRIVFIAIGRDNDPIVRS